MVEKLARKLAGLSFIVWEYISTYSPNLAEVVINNYSKPVIKKEIDVVKIKKEDKFIQIGCGSMPYTSFIIAELTGADVVGIDVDLVAVKNAKKYVQRYKKNPSTRIRIMFGDGVNHDLSGFDVIMVSLGVEALEEVFENIMKTAKSDARIIFRNISRYDPRGIVPEDFVIKKILRHPFFWESVILSKRLNRDA
ncbi:MAG: hypothetical protein DRN01_01315 [Thermoplasmata archaeon]|nr:MAG: hypothetical protein DRN01_01315 [Thermoplasmata archaeon]